MAAELGKLIERIKERKGLVKKITAEKRIEDILDGYSSALEVFSIDLDKAIQADKNIGIRTKKAKEKTSELNNFDLQLVMSPQLMYVEKWILNNYQVISQAIRFRERTDEYIKELKEEEISKRIAYNAERKLPKNKRRMGVYEESLMAYLEEIKKVHTFLEEYELKLIK